MSRGFVRPAGDSTYGGRLLPRRFALVRHVDYTGISGVGVVAYGVVFADGHVALRWSSDHPATSLWNRIEDLMAVHGHGEATSIEWLDPATDVFEPRSSTTARGRRARRVGTTSAQATTNDDAATDQPAPRFGGGSATTSRTDAAPTGETQEESASLGGSPLPPNPGEAAGDLVPESPPPPPHHLPTAQPPASTASGSRLSHTRSGLRGERSAAEGHPAEPRVPPQRRPGRHRRVAPEQESRTTQPIESEPTMTKSTTTNSTTTDRPTNTPTTELP